MALVRGPRPTPKSYRDSRPAPLNMALVPGLHLSTAKGRCPPRPAEDADACAPKHGDDSMDSCSTSADVESLASFGEADDSRSENSDSEPSSPFEGMLRVASHRSAMVQAGRGQALELDAVEALEPSSPFSRMLGARRQGAVLQAAEPDSPFSSMLRAKRQNASTRGL